MSKKILLKRSNQVVNGKAKLPTTSELDYGEIAINYHDGVETLSIKNDSGEVVTFATEENINKTELKLDQGFSYRKTNVDWNAKAALIKSVKGNSLTWNQLCSLNSINETTFTNGVKVYKSGDSIVVEVAPGGATAQRVITNAVYYDRKSVNGTKRLFLGFPETYLQLLTVWR